MLTNHEIMHCTELLTLLDVNTLYSLKDTVTKGLIVTNSRKEAINIILEQSSSVLQLLSRKKVTKDVILRYLLLQSIPVVHSSSKEMLIQSIIDYINNTVEATVSSSIPPLHASTSSYDFSQKPSFSVRDDYMTVDDAATNQPIAKQFIAWFYPMLNSLTGAGSSSGSNWTEKHFWPNCVLRCEITIREEFISECHEGAINVRDWLRSLVTNYNFVFNVNDTPNGYRGRITEHGFAEITASGTVHQISENCPPELCAVFEQTFGLLRDPTEDNRWKVKFTNLNVKSN